jgi:GNAT superfamily N-acetyltransferase
MSISIVKAEIKHIPSILGLIKELAEYERAPHEVILTEEQLKEDLFGYPAVAEALVATDAESVFGIAVYYTKYSTWKGKCIYLEDIVVKDTYRGKGIGKQLFKAVMQIAYERNAGRLEWQVLEWNTPAIKFYESFGAIIDPEWLNGKFTSEQLKDYFNHAGH